MVEWLEIFKWLGGAIMGVITAFTGFYLVRDKQQKDHAEKMAALAAENARIAKEKQDAESKHKSDLRKVEAEKEDARRKQEAESAAQRAGFEKQLFDQMTQFMDDQSRRFKESMDGRDEVIQSLQKNYKDMRTEVSKLHNLYITARQEHDQCRKDLAEERRISSQHTADLAEAQKNISHQAVQIKAQESQIKSMMEKIIQLEKEGRKDDAEKDIVSGT